MLQSEFSKGKKYEMNVEMRIFPLLLFTWYWYLVNTVRARSKMERRIELSDIKCKRARKMPRGRGGGLAEERSELRGGLAVSPSKWKKLSWRSPTIRESFLLCAAKRDTNR